MPESEFISGAAYPGVNLKFWLLGTVVEVGAYGVVFSLFHACFSSLRRALKSQSKERITTSFDANSNRMRRFLVAYILIMFLLSTLAAVAGIVGTFGLLFPGPSPSDGAQAVVRFVRFGDACSLVFSSWGADALMIWRCVVVYEGTSRPRQTALVVLLALLALISIGSGIAHISSALTFLTVYMIVFASITAAINAIIAGLIVLRLWRHQKYTRQILGERYGSPYLRIIHMCTESAALIVVFNVIHVVFAWTQHLNYVLVMSHQLLVHVYVISALLILYRASQAKGRLPIDARDEVHIRFTRSLLFEDPDPESIETREADSSRMNASHDISLPHPEISIA